jgi:hypothetical protein
LIIERAEEQVIVKEGLFNESVSPQRFYTGDFRKSSG